jgi:predicted enzyme related to lactoylglutathione lyase
MKSEVMLFVRDVEASSRWYQSLLGVKSGHGGPEYEMIVDDDGQLLFQFHKLAGEEHGVNLSDDNSPRGAGVLVYLNVPDVNVVYSKAIKMGATVDSAPTYIDLAGHTEFVVKDPDGYSLAIYTRGNRVKE